jgi:hypothetical protein
VLGDAGLGTVVEAWTISQSGSVKSTGGAGLERRSNEGSSIPESETESVEGLVVDRNEFSESNRSCRDVGFSLEGLDSS